MQGVPDSYQKMWMEFAMNKSSPKSTMTHANMLIRQPGKQPPPKRRRQYGLHIGGPHIPQPHIGRGLPQ